MDETPTESPPESIRPPQAGMPPGFPPPPEGRGSLAFYPLNVDRVIQLTVSLFRFRWRVFLGIALSVGVPVSILSGLLQAFTVEAIALSTQEMVLAVARGEMTAASLVALIPWTALGVTWLASLVISLISLVSIAAITHATALAFAGGRPGVTDSLREALRRFGPLAVVFLVPFFVTLAIFVGGGLMAALLVFANISNGAIQPGLFVFVALILIVAAFAIVIFIAVRWSFAVAAVMVDNARGLNALGRSWRLVTGSSWRVFGYVLLFGLLAGLPSGLIAYVVTAVLGSGVAQTATGLVANPVEAFISTLVIGVVAALFSPFPTIGVIVLYFDVRWRHGEPVPQPGEAVPSPAPSPPGPSGPPGPPSF